MLELKEKYRKSKINKATIELVLQSRPMQGGFFIAGGVSNAGITSTGKEFVFCLDIVIISR